MAVIGAQSHRNGRELPEVRHQPRVRIRRQAAAGSASSRRKFSSWSPSAGPPGKHANRYRARHGPENKFDRRRLGRWPVEKVIETDFVERGRRCEGGNMAADAVEVFVAAHDHGQGIPAHQALDAAFDFRLPGEGRLPVAGDGIDVRGIGGESDVNAAAIGLELELGKDIASPFDPLALQYPFQRIQPFACLSRIGIDLSRPYRDNVAGIGFPVVPLVVPLMSMSKAWFAPWSLRLTGRRRLAYLSFYDLLLNRPRGRWNSLPDNRTFPHPQTAGRSAGSSAGTGCWPHPGR